MVDNSFAEPVEIGDSVSIDHNDITKMLLQKVTEKDDGSIPICISQ